MVAWRYEISLLVLKKIFHLFASLTREIFFHTRREISYPRAAMEYPLYKQQKNKTKKNKQNETKIKQTNKQKKNHARKLSRNQSIRFDVILQQDWPIEQCLLQIIGFLWPENE